MLEAIGRQVEDRRDDLVALTSDLIRIPSVNPPGEAYRDCCELIARRLKPLGFEATFVRAEGTPGDSDRYPRWNVIARREGRRPGACVHFNSHIDVVEAGAGWSFDPFGGAVRDGRVYGRGACDMKGGLATSIVAVEAFLALYPDHPGAIEISGTADEESGGYGGVAYLADTGLMARPRIDHVIIPEPLNKDRICLGHRGVWWAEIETKGRIAHGSMPFLGDSAIRHMGAVLDAFEAELYPALGRRRTSMPVVPDGARQSTININSIHGGMGEDYSGFPSACVADSCRMVIDRRFLIEEDLAAVKDEVRGILDRLARDARQLPLRAARHVGRDPDHDRPRRAGGALGFGGDRRGARPRPGLRRLARHLRPEAHRPHRPDQGLHRLRAGHPRSRPPAGRIRR